MDTYKHNRYRHRPVPHRSATTEERYYHHRGPRGEEPYPRYRTPSPLCEEPSPRDRRRSSQWEDPYTPEKPRGQRSERSHMGDSVRDQRDDEYEKRDRRRSPRRKGSYTQDGRRSSRPEESYMRDPQHEQQSEGRYAGDRRRDVVDDSNYQAHGWRAFHTYDCVFDNSPPSSTPRPQAQEPRNSEQPEREEGILPAAIVEPDGTTLWRNPNYQEDHSSRNPYSSGRGSGGRRRSVPNDTDFDGGVRPPRMRRSRTEGSRRP